MDKNLLANLKSTFSTAKILMTDFVAEHSSAMVGSMHIYEFGLRYVYDNEFDMEQRAGASDSSLRSFKFMLRSIGWKRGGWRLWVVFFFGCFFPAKRFGGNFIQYDFTVLEGLVKGNKPLDK